MPKIPKIKLSSRLKKSFKIEKKEDTFRTIVIPIILISLIFGFVGGVFGFYFLSKGYFDRLNEISKTITGIETEGYAPQTMQEERVIKAVEEVSPAVVSIIISKDVPVFEQYIEQYQQVDPFFGPLPFEFQVPRQRQIGTEKRQIGGGTGVIVSDDGYIITNKHVVSDDESEYTVYTNSGKKFNAEILATDPVNDLAVIKIEPEAEEEGIKAFKIAKLGDSEDIQLGQTVIAIGNALGEFKNTISVGVISGLGRRVSASGGGITEILEDVIQTDAAINQGNSGGPLINLKGEVIGINTATMLEAQSIGFSIPINKAKRDIVQVKNSGKISYPFLGVRYLMINEAVKEKYDLSVDNGAYIQKGKEGESAIAEESAAEEAGLKEGDIIIEINGEKIDINNSLIKIISKYSPGDKITIKYLRDGQEETTEATLGER